MLADRKRTRRRASACNDLVLIEASKLSQACDAYSMRHASRVKKLRLQLSDYQRLLDTKYLESQHKTAKEILEKQKDFFEAQSLDLQYVISRLASGFTETDALFLSEAGQIRKDVKEEHENTRKSVVVPLSKPPCGNYKQNVDATKY